MGSRFLQEGSRGFSHYFCAKTNNLNRGKKGIKMKNRYSSCPALSHCFFAWLQEWLAAEVPLLLLPWCMSGHKQRGQWKSFWHCSNKQTKPVPLRSSNPKPLFALLADDFYALFIATGSWALISGAHLK